MRTLTLALVLVVQPLLADAPDHPDKLKYPPLEFQVPKGEEFRTTLPNGMVVYIAEDHELPTLDVTATVRVGTWLDPAGREGLAEMTADQLRAGGTESMTPEALDDRLAFLAAQVSSQASLTSGEASLSCLSKDADEALAIFAEVLHRPAFDEKRLALCKEETLTRMKGRNDRTATIEEREWNLLLYGDHAETRLATKASIEAITRQDLVDFHAKYWFPKGVILAVTGDFKRDEMLKKLEGLFAGWEGGDTQVAPIAAPTQDPAPGVYMFDKPKVNQGRVSIGHVGIGRDNPDHYAVTLLNYVFGGGSFTSRITLRVRNDEGLAYHVASAFQPGTYYPGVFRILFQSKSETCAWAAKLCIEEMQKVIDAGVTEKELAAAKSYYVESFPNRFASKKETLATFVEEEYTGREKGYYERFRENIEKVTFDDVKRVAKAYLHPDKLVIVVVGNLAAIRKGDAAHPATFDDLGKATVLPLADPFTLKR